MDRCNIKKFPAYSDLNLSPRISACHHEQNDETNSNTNWSEETKVFHTAEDILQTIKLTFQDCKNTLDLCVDTKFTTLLMDASKNNELLLYLKKNNINKRILVDMTKQNPEYRKQISELLGGEVKQLDGIKTNFAIIDKSLYMTSSSILENKNTLSQLILSNVKSIAEQNLQVFEKLWEKGIPINESIVRNEISLLPIETRILVLNQEIFTQITDFVEKSDCGVSICTPIGGLQLLNNFKPLLESYKNLIKRHKAGKIKEGIRWLTHIENNREQIILVKKFIDLGINIRHLNNLPPISFGVSEKQFQNTVEKMLDGKMIQSLLHSTEPLYVQHYQSLFEDMWNSAISSHDRILQIEKGTSLESTKIIENPAHTKLQFIEIVQNAGLSILILFPSLNAVIREVKMGIIDLLKKKSKEGIKIRILSPVNDKVIELLSSKNVVDKKSNVKNILSGEIGKLDDLISTIVIVDRKYVLATELRDDSKEIFEEAIGVSTYSSSKPTVLSYISIFESLWAQTEMSDNLKIANIKLVQSEQLEREFINTAAHELRTPTQAIMGYAELDKEIFHDILKTTESLEYEKLRENIIQLFSHFEALSRNAYRLNDLISNLLDVARIESNKDNSLQLHKEKMDLVREINNSIEMEFAKKIKQKNIEINFINECINEPCWIYADKLRISQIINNLIGNALKFTGQNGKMDILIKDVSSDLSEGEVRKKHIFTNNVKDVNPGRNEIDNTREQILVGISDTGKGISPKIFSKLFKKFITDSDTGTGLGLYITRNLVEAHGGKIWAFNNANGIGSTFVFKLPKRNYDDD